MEVLAQRSIIADHSVYFKWINTQLVYKFYILKRKKEMFLRFGKLPKRHEWNNQARHHHKLVLPFC